MTTEEWFKNHGTHRWSGWPGAWCFDCGISDPVELACADPNFDPEQGIWVTGSEVPVEYVYAACTEPGSGRNNPYTGGKPE